MRMVTPRVFVVFVFLAVLLAPLPAAAAQDDAQSTGPDYSQPLGSFKNPVRTPRGGQPGYLQRLRCPDGEAPVLGGRGSLGGEGPYGNIIDRWTITCGETEHSVHMDHYHRGYVEKLPVPGFELASRQTPQLIVRDDVLYRFGSEEPFSGEIIDETENGEPAAEMMVVNGLLEGTLTRFFEGGPVATETRFVNGREHGPFRVYFPDGRTRQEGTYVQGALENVRVAYYPSGRLLEAVAHHAGLPHGEGIAWNDQGAETNRLWFFEGQRVDASVAEAQGLKPIDMFAPFVAEPGEELWALAVPVGADIAEPAKILDSEPQSVAQDVEAGARVELEVVVATDGRVGATRLAASSGSAAFDQAVATAVRQWRYEPTVVHGKAVPVSMTVSVEYQR